MGFLLLLTYFAIQPLDLLEGHARCFPVPESLVQKAKPIAKHPVTYHPPRPRMRRLWVFGKGQKDPPLNRVNRPKIQVFFQDPTCISFFEIWHFFETIVTNGEQSSALWAIQSTPFFLSCRAT